LGNDDSLLISESAVNFALMERVKRYAPSKESVINDCLLNTSWGNTVIQLWKNKPFEKVLNSLGETVDEQVSPLSSLLSHVQIRGNGMQSIRYFEPVKWEEPVYYPNFTDKPTNQQVQKYWNEVADSWITFIKTAPQEREVRLSHFIDWIDTYLSCVPVNEESHSIQLSNHFRLMIALCVVCKDSDSFQLVLGDVSGIQAYLFDVAHIGVGKVAKRLRARSFSLGLIADGAAHRLLIDTGMPLSNLILSAGGLFYAIIPSGVSIDGWAKKINQHLYSRYHGAIALHFAISEIHISEISNKFPDILSSLYEKIQISKGNPFENILKPEDHWEENVFIHGIDEHKDLCDSCRKFSKVDSEFCEFCKMDETIGKLLTRTNYLVFKEGNGLIQLGSGISVDLLEKINKETSFNQAYFIQVWNNSDSSYISLPFQRKWVANYIPTASKNLPKITEDKELENVYEGEPLSFSHMAHYGTGKDLIGYLKADVDNLGMLFTIGLVSGEKDSKPHTLSHIVTLSRMLERFFAGGVNHWLKEKYRLTYTVFSGGDDLFLVGPWEEILKAASELRNRFREYVGSNPDVTLSAGVQIFKPKFPLPHATKYVEQGLEDAKDSISRIRMQNGGTEGRNQISVLGSIMEWKDFKTIKDTSVKLAKWWKAEKLSSSFIYQLNNFSEMYKKYKDDGENRYLRFVPLLEYSIQRNLIEGRSLNLRDGKDNEILYWLRDLQKIEDPSLPKHKENEIDLIWGYMGLIIKLSSYYR
jgi:CRISPR-associated protein Csm1